MVKYKVLNGGMYDCIITIYHPSETYCIVDKTFTNLFKFIRNELNVNWSFYPSVDLFISAYGSTVATDISLRPDNYNPIIVTVKNVKQNFHQNLISELNKMFRISYKESLNDVGVISYLTLLEAQLN